MPADKKVEPATRAKRATRASSADKSPPRAPKRSTRASSSDKSPPPGTSRRQSVALKKISEETQERPSTPTKAKNTEDDVPAVGTPKRRGRASLNPTPAAVASPVRVTRRSVAALAEEVPAVVSSPRRKSRASINPSVTASPARVTRNSLAVNAAEEETEAKPQSPPTRSKRKSMLPKAKLQAHDEDVSLIANAPSVENIEESPENRPSSATSQEVESITKLAEPDADRSDTSGQNTPTGSANDSSGHRTPETKIPTRSNRTTPTGSGEVRTPPQSQGGSRPSTPVTRRSPRNIPDSRRSTKPSPDRHVHCNSRDSSPIFVRDLRRNSFQSPVRCSPRSSPSRPARLSSGESKDASPKSGSKPTSPLVTERRASPLHKNSTRSSRVENDPKAKQASVSEKHNLDDEDDTLMMPNKKVKRNAINEEAGPSTDAGPPQERDSPSKKSVVSLEQKVEEKPTTISNAESAKAVVESDAVEKSRSSTTHLDPIIQESKLSNEAESSSDVQGNVAVAPSETAVDKPTPVEGSGSPDENQSIETSGESVKDITSSVEVEVKFVSSKGDSERVSDAGHRDYSNVVIPGIEALSRCGPQDLELNVEGSDSDEHEELELTVVNSDFNESGIEKSENPHQGEVEAETTVIEKNSDVPKVETPAILMSAKSPEKCESGEGKTPIVIDTVVANSSADFSCSDVQDPRQSASKLVESPAKCENGMSDGGEVAVASTTEYVAASTETPCTELTSIVDLESGEFKPDETEVNTVCSADQNYGDRTADETAAKESSDVPSFKSDSGEFKTSVEAEAPDNHKSTECNSSNDPNEETSVVEESSNASFFKLESVEVRTTDVPNGEASANKESEAPSKSEDSPSKSEEDRNCGQDETVVEESLGDGCDAPNSQTRSAIKKPSDASDAPVKSEVKKLALDHILIDEGYSETSDSEYHFVGAADNDAKDPSISEGLGLKDANQDVSSVNAVALPSPEKLRMGCDSVLEKIPEDDESACEGAESKTAGEDKLVLLENEVAETMVCETADPDVTSPLKLAVSPEPSNEDNTVLRHEADTAQESPSKVVEKDNLGETDSAAALGKLGLKKYEAPSSKTGSEEETVGTQVEQDCGTDVYENDTGADSDEEKTRDGAPEKIEAVEDGGVEIYENDTTSIPDSDEEEGPVKGSDFIDDEAEEGEESENEEFIYDETEGSDSDSEVELLDQSCFIVDEAVEVRVPKEKPKDGLDDDDEIDPEIEDSENFDDIGRIVRDDEGLLEAEDTSESGASDSKTPADLDAKNYLLGKPSEKSGKVVNFDESCYIVDETTSEEAPARTTKTPHLVKKPVFEVSELSHTDEHPNEFASGASSQFVVDSEKSAKAESAKSAMKKSRASKTKKYASTAAAEFVVSETATKSKPENPLKSASASPQKSDSSYTSSDAEQENSARAAKIKKRPAAEIEADALKEKKKFKKMTNAQLFCVKLCNVAPRTTIEELKKALRQFGIATGLQRLEFCPRVDRHKKTALAAYDSQKNLEKALTGYGKVRVHDRTIFFLLDDETAPVTKDSQCPVSPKKSPRKKFVGIIGELSKDVTIGDIVAAYETEGIRFINKVKIYKLRSSKDDMNFAKLEFSKKTALLKAIIVTENIKIKGKKISLKIKERSSAS